MSRIWSLQNLPERPPKIGELVQVRSRRWLVDEVIPAKIPHDDIEKRVAQRLLARFRAQGFIYNDLSRACLAQTSDSIPRVVLLGRLSLETEPGPRPRVLQGEGDAHRASRHCLPLAGEQLMVLNGGDPT